MLLSSRIEQALEQHEFTLHYQPIVDVTSGQVDGVEALIRWHLPGGGTVSPARSFRTPNRRGHPPDRPLGAGSRVPRRGAVVARQRTRTARLRQPLGRVDAVDLDGVDDRRSLASPSVAAAPADSGDHRDRRSLGLVGSPQGARRNRRAGRGSAAGRLWHGPLFAQLPDTLPDPLHQARSVLRRAHRQRSDQRRDHSRPAGPGPASGPAHRGRGRRTGRPADLPGEAGCSLLQGFHFARPMPAERLAYWLDKHRLHQTGGPSGQVQHTGVDG